MKRQRVQVVVRPCEVQVLIHGLPHLLLRRADLGAIQAYVQDAGPRSPVYYIEFSQRGGAPVICDYDKRDLWMALLAALRDARLFDHMQGQRPLPGSA